MTPAQVSEAVSGFASAYVNDWESWLSVPGPAEAGDARADPPPLAGDATAPDAPRARRGDTPRAVPRGPVRRCPGVDRRPRHARPLDVQAANGGPGAVPSGPVGELQPPHRHRRGFLRRITKSILLVTDGRIGPAFDSTVRTRLRLERPRYSTDWIGAVDLIADDLAAFESRHGPLAEAVPKRFRHLAVGRLYDMALGPRGAYSGQVPVDRSCARSGAVVRPTERPRAEEAWR